LNNWTEQPDPPETNPPETTGSSLNQGRPHATREPRRSLSDFEQRSAPPDSRRKRPLDPDQQHVSPHRFPTL
jgi:hypothetical protein